MAFINLNFDENKFKDFFEEYKNKKIKEIKEIANQEFLDEKYKFSEDEKENEFRRNLNLKETKTKDGIEISISKESLSNEDLEIEFGGINKEPKGILRKILFNIKTKIKKWKRN